jgi:L-fuconolactonase
VSTAARRIVDPHVHLWDPARPDWYPLLVGKRTMPNMGDISGMCRKFDEAVYLSESARWNIEKYIHVAAADSSFTLAETDHFEALAREGGHPDGIVGGVTPSSSLADMVSMLDAQMISPRFRGIRIMGPRPKGQTYLDLLNELRDRDLVYDLMTRPNTMLADANELAGIPDLSVVVEHTGWPRSSTTDEFALWSEGMSALASIGPNVTCKLSGLAVPLSSVDPSVMAPWIDLAIELFGPERCMFASNFPVDGLHGSFDHLYSAFALIASQFSEDSQDLLFAGTAERVYRC